MKIALALVTIGTLSACGTPSDMSRSNESIPGRGRVAPNQLLVKVGSLNKQADAAALKAARIHIAQSKAKGLVSSSFEKVSADGSVSFCLKSNSVDAVSQALSRVLWVSAQNGFDSRFSPSFGACEDLKGNYSFSGSSLGAFTQLDNRTTLTCTAYEASTQTNTRVELVEKVINQQQQIISTQINIQKSSPTARYAPFMETIKTWQIQNFSSRSFGVVYNGFQSKLLISPVYTNSVISYNAQLIYADKMQALTCR